MTTPIDTGRTAAEKVDALDQLLSSDGWQLVRDRLVLQLNRDLSDLERDSTPETTARVRGHVARTRMLLDLPGMMRDEFRREISKG